MGHDGRLPGNGLPAARAFDECARIEIIRDLGRSASCGRRDKTERHDRRLAILMYLDIFGCVGRFRVVGFRRRRCADAIHQFSLVCAHTRGTCIDQIVGPEAIVDGSIIVGRAGEKFVK